MLMAMLDGIQNKNSARASRSTATSLRDDPRGDERVGIRTTPGRSRKHRRFSSTIHAFLVRRDVFTEDLFRRGSRYKREKELDPIRLRPHPHEFFLYYDN